MVGSALKNMGLVVILGINPLSAGFARAALGGDGASIDIDAAELHGVVHSQVLQQYDIHEITAGGEFVREFLSRDGVVFAVTWSGPIAPDLQRLLGAHFAAYRDALAAQKPSGLQRSLRVATADLVVESGGHMRALSGRAYLPALLPVGTSTAELR